MRSIFVTTNWESMIWKATTIFGTAFVYTIARYWALGTESIEQFPVYLFNKSICLAAVVSLALSVYFVWKRRIEYQEFWGSAFMYCVWLHVLLSLAILSPDYFPKFFNEEKMNLVGEFSILFGVLGVFFFILASKKKYSSAIGNLSKIVAVFLIGGHLLAMGIQNWAKVENWNGGLPPISLLSFFFVSAASAYLALVILKPKT